MSNHRAENHKKPAPFFTGKRIGLSVVLLGTAAGIAGLGTFGDFSSTTTASRTDSAGTVVVALATDGTTTNGLTVGSTGLVPGDTVQRAFDINNTGDQAFASVAMTTSATASNLLNTDTTNGLQMKIDSCATAWTESAGPVFTCTSPTVVLASRPIVGSAIALSNLSLTSSAVNHLRLTVSFPSTADNTFQGLSTTTNFSFLATQRTATNK